MIFGHMGFTYIVYNTHYINILHIYKYVYHYHIRTYTVIYRTM